MLTRKFQIFSNAPKNIKALQAEVSEFVATTEAGTEIIISQSESENRITISIMYTVQEEAVVDAG